VSAPAYRGVFKDESKLDLNYVPMRLVHREGEMRLLAEFFNFLLTTPEKWLKELLLLEMRGLARRRFLNVLDWT